MQNATKAGLRRRSRVQGFTILEMIVTVAIVLLAMMALTSTSLAIHTLRRENIARSTSLKGMQSLTEEIRSFSQGALESPAGWSQSVTAAYAPGGAMGNAFPLQGLEAWVGEPGVLQITVVTDETSTDAALGINLGMPRDLNADGLATSVDVSNDARVLPVILRARWRANGGNRELVQGFFLLGY